jgi:hypothetical protein
MEYVTIQCERAALEIWLCVELISESRKAESLLIRLYEQLIANLCEDKRSDLVLRHGVYVVWPGLLNSWMFLEPCCRGVLSDWKAFKNPAGCSLISNLYFEHGPNVPNWLCVSSELAKTCYTTHSLLVVYGPLRRHIYELL